MYIADYTDISGVVSSWIVSGAHNLTDACVSLRLRRHVYCGVQKHRHAAQVETFAAGADQGESNDLFRPVMAQQLLVVVVAAISEMAEVVESLATHTYKRSDTRKWPLALIYIIYVHIYNVNTNVLYIYLHLEISMGISLHMHTQAYAGFRPPSTRVQALFPCVGTGNWCVCVCACVCPVT